jgi:hypothetical protein
MNDDGDTVDALIGGGVTHRRIDDVGSLPPAYQNVLEEHLGGGVVSGQRCS